MQNSLPAGWLAFAGRELNPLDRYERFPSCYISSPFPEFILTLGSNELGEGVRRRGGGRKSAIELQPGLLSALEELIEGAIRGDPQSPLRWVSRSQRNIATALRQQGFAVSQKLVGLLLRELDYSCQANRKTREGTQHPDAMRSSSTSMPG